MARAVPCFFILTLCVCSTLKIAITRLRLLFLATLSICCLHQVDSRYMPRKTRVTEVIGGAFAQHGHETIQLRRRHITGVDNFPGDFHGVEPAILEAVKRPLDSLAEEIGGMSRVINWVQAVSRSKNLPLDLPTILKTAPAKNYNLRCPYVKPTDCNSREKYRRVDGRCNNLLNPLWGAGFTPMARDLPAHYDTGIQYNYLRNDLPRQSGRSGARLPSARLVSNIVHSSSSVQLSSPATMAFVFFGQLTAHDVTDTAFERGFRGAFLDCCNQDILVRGCANIPVPTGDFFRGFGRDCLPFARAKEVTDLECEIGSREQLNMVSSFVDGSNMYGHTEDILLTLRGEEGQLKTSQPNHPPYQVHPNMAASENGINFMNAGDERVSEVIGLTGITTVWIREHNRIAQQLAKFSRFSAIVNATKRSKAIFEEARKITVAFKQHITYNEFIRLAVGPAAMNQYKLEPLTSGFFSDYDAKVNPTMRNEVIVSAQRFGHSLLRSFLSVLNGDFSPAEDTLHLRKIFWRPNFYLLFENGFQRGVSTDAGEVCDRHVNDEVRDHLFETKNGNGEDLVARNIQRGRDHGVPAYNKVREDMDMSKASTFTAGGPTGFEDLSDEVVNKLQMVYQHPDDVDLFTGGISETPVEGGIVGPLFSRMLGKQFHRLRVGDRFWYESPTTGFTLEQLNEIRKVSMSYIMCQNVNGLKKVQPSLFRLPTFGGDNNRVPCNDLRQIDLTKWQ